MPIRGMDIITKRNIMEKLTLYFEEGPIAVGPIGQRLLAAFGGLDLSQPTKWGRYGMGICEDYVGYPVCAPRRLTSEELYELVSVEAEKLGIPRAEPEDRSDRAILFAVNQTTRAISAANGQDIGENTLTNMDFSECAEDAVAMFLAVLDNLADGTAVQNHVIRYSR